MQKWPCSNNRGLYATGTHGPAPDGFDGQRDRKKYKIIILYHALSAVVNYSTQSVIQRKFPAKFSPIFNGDRLVDDVGCVILDISNSIIEHNFRSNYKNQRSTCLGNFSWAFPPQNSCPSPWYSMQAWPCSNNRGLYATGTHGPAPDGFDGQRGRRKTKCRFFWNGTSWTQIHRKSRKNLPIEEQGEEEDSLLAQI